VAGDFDLDGAGFHALCLERMDAVGGDALAGNGDQSAFTKGCMYDIVDRFLLRFVRPA
jgi:hypothetical protein